MRRTTRLYLLLGVGLLLICSAGMALAVPTMDGIRSPGEWDSFSLGTVTAGVNPGDDTITEVYATADDTYLYVAWATDPSQPGYTGGPIGPNFYVQSYPYTPLYDGDAMPADRLTLQCWSTPLWAYGVDGPTTWGGPNTGFDGENMAAGYVNPPSGKPASFYEFRIKWSVFAHGKGTHVRLYGQYWNYQMFPASKYFFVSGNGGTPSVVYVDDDWVGKAPGARFDGGMKIFGVNAFAKIQDGINAVASGGTVNVLAGNYPEAITVNKSISLLGAQHGSTPVPGGRGGVAGESRIDATGWKYRQINVTGDDVTVDGFMFDSCHEAVNCTIVRSLHQNVTISNNYFVGASSTAAVSLMPNGGVATTFKNFTISNNLIDFGGSAKGINLSAGATPPYVYDGLTIEENVIKCSNYGLFAGGTVAHFEVRDAVISGNTFQSSSGVNIAKLKNPSITRNTFSNVTGSAISVGAEGGIVSGNTIVGGTTAPSGTGINVYGGQYGSYLGGGLSVSDNTISMAATGIQIRGGVDGAAIKGNSMTDCTVGLLLTANGGIATASSATDISDNTIDGVGDVGFAIVGITGPSAEVDLGSSSIATGYTNFVTLTDTPVNVDATSATFSGASDDASKEAKVWHDVDDAALGHVNWGQNGGAPATACALVVSNVTGTVGQTVQLSAKLTAGGDPIASQSVAFSVNGFSASATTDAAGVAAVAYGPLTAGDKTITAKFSGVSPYKATAGTGNLTVNVAAPTAITLTLTPSSLVSGEATTCTVLGDNDEDLTGKCTYYVQYGAGGSWSAAAPKNIYTAAKAGTWNVTAVYNTLTDSKPLTVTAGAATAVTLTPATATINADETQTYVVTATDAAGNVSTPPASCLSHNGTGSLTDYTYTAAAGDAGHAVTITATVAHAAAVTATLNVNETAGVGTILAWDKDTKKFYMCSNATNPAAGAEITGSGIYEGIPVVVSGTGTNVTVTAAGTSLRVQWYLRSGSLYRAYQYSTGTSAGSKTATFDGTRTLVDGTWKSGFYGLTHTISGGTATYGSAQQ